MRVCASLLDSMKGARLRGWRSMSTLSPWTIISCTASMSAVQTRGLHLPVDLDIMRGPYSGDGEPPWRPPSAGPRSHIMRQCMQSSRRANRTGQQQSLKFCGSAAT